MPLAACDSSEPRGGEEDYSDAAIPDKDSKSQAAKGSDAGSGTSKDTKVQTDDKASAQSGDKCGEDTCKEPATCKDDKCVCPEGYEDTKGDGSECKDIDECKTRKAECPRGAACKNEPGGYECMCNGPAYEQDGDECKCAKGYERNDEGFCVGDDGNKCLDGIDCKNGHCEGGICCAQSCGEPGECHVTDGAKCSDDGKSCIYPIAKDGVSCDDGKACTKDGTCKEGACEESKEPTNCNDGNSCTDDSCEEPTGCRNQNNDANSCDDASACTSEDKCMGGQCKGTEKDCSGAADACNTGSCDAKTGECTKEPRKTSAACDDANSCTSDDTCKDGACVGTSACGPNATACEPGSGGEPNMCTCSEGFVTFAGRCVPMNDECQRMNPCSENGLCTDPSNTDGDVTCACKPGFSGNGVECVETDPCAANPCGAGNTCENLDAGKYKCTCAAGQREVNGKCGCDLSGTFAVRTSNTTSWEDVDQFVEDGSVEVQAWMLQKHSYDADGNLKLDIVECGGSTYDLCSVPFEPFLGAEAYGQYVPFSVFGIPSMPHTNITMSLPDSQPGAAFKSDMFAMVNGIKLDDPMGPWPKDRREVAGSPDSEGTPVNGATWLDSDNDGSAGLTTLAVGPEGDRIDGMPPDPPKDYGTRSEECPRRNDGERSPYAYPPAIPNGSLAVQRVKRVFAAQRATFAYDGKIDSCDAINGVAKGPDDGIVRVEGRIAGCVRVNGNGETACGSGTVDFLDQQPQTQKFSETKLQIRRLAEGATCADVWKANFD